MRVLMWLNRGSEIAGGHRIQLEQTADALGKLGVEVDTHFGPDLPAVLPDLVHGFQLGAREVNTARKHGLPVVISTIYVGLSYSAGGASTRPGVRARLGRIRRGVRHLSRSIAGREALTRLALKEMTQELDQIKAWSMADMLLPNAQGEARHIVEDLGVMTESHVVPNAVDAGLFTTHFDHPRPPNTLICVGRVEPHKNQLALIRAMEHLPDVELTIAGPAHPHHPSYWEKCRDSAGPNVHIVGPVDHSRLPELYAAHHSHVLPSWYETTGLVSLEAALSGCSIVTTSRGHAHEYVGSDGFYCDPAEPESIVRAVKESLRARPSIDLFDRICARFTWTQTAEETLRAYLKVLERRKGS